MQEFYEVKYIDKLEKYNFGNKYKCSGLGLIYHKDSVNPLKPFTDGKRGYLKVKLYDINNKPITLFVHRIICIMFHGEPNSLRNQTNHIDGNKLNNEYTNLEWLSLRENIRHSIDNKLSPSRSIQFDLSTVHKICEELFKNNKSMLEVSSSLNVSYDAVHKIYIRKNYKYISELYLST